MTGFLDPCRLCVVRRCVCCTDMCGLSGPLQPYRPHISFCKEGTTGKAQEISWPVVIYLCIYFWIYLWLPLLAMLQLQAVFPSKCEQYTNTSLCLKTKHTICRNPCFCIKPKFLSQLLVSLKKISYLHSENEDNSAMVIKAVSFWALPLYWHEPISHGNI